MADVEAGALIDADDVREVISTELADGTINVFINQAYYRTIPIANLLGDCGGSGALAAIQTMLAAHFISSSRERQAKSESIEGGASISYAGTTGDGLKSTSYGQAAIDMDCSGILAMAGLKRASVKIFSHSEIDYDTDARSATLDAA